MLKKIIRRFHIKYLKFIRHRWEGFKYRKIAELPDTDILQIDSFYYLGLVAILRGEDDYLVEWIEFHKMMGVNHFILYDNGLEKSSGLILHPYIERGIVTHIPFSNIPGLKDGRHADTLSLQQLAYADCIIRFRHHFQYLLQLDIDEFLFPKNHKTISEVLKSCNEDKISRIDVNWTNFGSNGHEAKPTGLVIENFTKSAESIVNSTVKCIVNTKYLSIQHMYSNVHRFSLRVSFKDIITKFLYGYPYILKGKNANNLFQLNHYITKSKKEFLDKGGKFKNGWQTGKKTKELYYKLNSQFNQIENTAILKFLPQLTKSIKQNK